MRVPPSFNWKVILTGIGLLIIFLTVLAFIQKAQVDPSMEMVYIDEDAAIFQIID